MDKYNKFYYKGYCFGSYKSLLANNYEFIVRYDDTSFKLNPESDIPQKTFIVSNHPNKLMILPKGREKIISHSNIITNIKSVLGKNPKLSSMVTKSFYNQRPRNDYYFDDQKAEHAFKLLVMSHLQDIPDLLNNRRKMVEILTMEVLL